MKAPREPLAALRMPVELVAGDGFRATLCRRGMSKEEPLSGGYCVSKAGRVNSGATTEAKASSR